MGAKIYQFDGGRAARLCLVVLAISLAGCANAKRFLPPGFVKYEDLAKDTPVNPQIEAAIEKQVTDTDGEFPRFRDQPDRPPENLSKAQREAAAQELLAARDALDDNLDKDRERAAEERDGSELGPNVER